MHLSRTYRSFAFVLALLMCITSLGFTVDMHYCGGELKSFSLLGKAKNCHELMEAATMSNCPNHQQMAEDEQLTAMGEEGCCTHKTHHLKADQDQVFKTLDLSLETQEFLTAFVFAFLNVEAQADLEPFTHYKPPLIFRDIPVLNQSFLL